MRGVVFRVFDGIAVLRPKLGILNSNGLIDCRMSGDVRSIVRKRAQREGVLVGILTLQQELSHKVTAANVVHQIAEFHAAERIVAEVLDDSAAIRVTVCFLELLFRQRWKSLEKKRLQFIGPHQVHDFLVRQHGICERAACA